jgi:hypothetical protein
VNADKRLFLEEFIARMEVRIAARRAMPDRRSQNIADTLARIIAADRAELDAAPAPIVDAPVPISSDRVTWKHPVFNAGGRFNPFAGTYAERMLASADVCDRLGYPDIADGYRAIAARHAEGCPEVVQVTELASEQLPRRPMKRRREIWTGPNMPPPEPVPFVAGEQMGFAL